MNAFGLLDSPSFAPRIQMPGKEKLGVTYTSRAVWFYLAEFGDFSELFVWHSLGKFTDTFGGVFCLSNSSERFTAQYSATGKYLDHSQIDHPLMSPSSGGWRRKMA
ncbi:hypothetical protein AAG570_004197 [Ranatra chinensis]|uniref:Uncharacterized protein n=1 Tax=Ranatra chinensis TaxID=642074 RepID=A0ABD0YPW7_9HEMI